jgi:hypothetical protein
MFFVRVANTGLTVLRATKSEEEGNGIVEKAGVSTRVFTNCFLRRAKRAKE